MKRGYNWQCIEQQANFLNCIIFLFIFFLFVAMKFFVCFIFPREVVCFEGLHHIGTIFPFWLKCELCFSCSYHHQLLAHRNCIDQILFIKDVVASSCVCVCVCVLFSVSFKYFPEFLFVFTISVSISFNSFSYTSYNLCKRFLVCNLFTKYLNMYILRFFAISSFITKKVCIDNLSK